MSMISLSTSLVDAGVVFSAILGALSRVTHTGATSCFLKAMGLAGRKSSNTHFSDFIFSKGRDGF